MGSKRIVLMIVWCLISTIQLSHACSCVGELSNFWNEDPATFRKVKKKFWKESFNDSVSIFSGKVIASEAPENELYGEVFVFKILDLYKGKRGDEIKIYPYGYKEIENGLVKTIVGCFRSFEIGKEYLVYATKVAKDRKLLTTHYCSRTKKLSEAKEDIEFLQETLKKAK